MSLGGEGLPRGKNVRFSDREAAFMCKCFCTTPPGGVGKSPPCGEGIPLEGVYWSPPWGKDSHYGCNILPRGKKPPIGGVGWSPS